MRYIVWHKNVPDTEKMNFLFIRGEDSLSRAVLCGVPFVWHAYIQDENYHLVKVNALLDLLTQKFSIEEKKYLTELWNDYNTPNKPLNENLIGLLKCPILLQMFYLYHEIINF